MDAEEDTHPEPKEWQRFYMGYHERFVDDCVIPLQCGAEVRIAQAPSARTAQRKGSKGNTLDKASDPALTGTTVWDGAVVLSHVLADTDVLQTHCLTRSNHQREASGQLQGSQQDAGPGDPGLSASSTPHGTGIGWTGPPRCLELGAGTGAVSLSLVAARRVASVTITDISDVLPHIQLNVQRNKHLIAIPSAVRVQELRWGPEGAADLTKLPHTYDLIVGSDLIYYSYTEATPHTKLLLWTLERLCQPHTVIYLALSLHHNPEEVEHFLSLAADSFTVDRLKAEVPEEWRVPDVIVVRLRLRRTAETADTLTALPGGDGELLPQTV